MKEKKDSVPKFRCEAGRDFPLSKKLPGPEISFLGVREEWESSLSLYIGHRAEWGGGGRGWQEAIINFLTFGEL